MKRILTISAVALLTATLWAQSPEKMSYQAVIRDANNNLVTSHAVGMKISILQGSASGTSVYVETQSPSTNANGLVSIEIGGGTVASGNFTTIDWTTGTFFIKTETDPSGGTTYTITGTSQLLSVPYALHAKTAETVIGTITETDPLFSAWDKDYNELINRPTLPLAADGSETKLTSGTNILITGSGTTASPYVVNSASNHFPGEPYGGGVVFWVDHTGQHGLICSLISFAESEWSDVTSIQIGTMAESNWDGRSNCDAIIAQSISTSTADICDSYTNANYGTGIYSDWYLPSRGELVHLWDNYYEVVKSIDINGYVSQMAIVSRFYWSSTEGGSNVAWGLHFGTGDAEAHFKSDLGSIIAVRAF